MMVDPRMVVMAKAAWKWFSIASSVVAAEGFVLYAMTCFFLAGHPLALRDYEKFVHYLFLYRF